MPNPFWPIRARLGCCRPALGRACSKASKAQTLLRLLLRALAQSSIVRAPSACSKPRMPFATQKPGWPDFASLNYPLAAKLPNFCVAKAIRGKCWLNKTFGFVQALALRSRAHARTLHARVASKQLLSFAEHERSKLPERSQLSRRPGPVTPNGRPEVLLAEGQHLPRQR